MSPRLTASEWEARLGARPEAHLLQTAAWAEFKSNYGWQALWIGQGAAGAQVLLRALPGGPRLAYVPKGPWGEWIPDLLPELEELCRRERAFLLKVEPDVESGVGIEDALRRHGFQPSPHPVQPRRTLVVSLDGDEQAWLARMHPKTRYNILLAGRKGVQIRPWDDLAAFGTMMQTTAERQAFGIHHPDYYRRAYEVFHPRGECELLVAEWEGNPLAAVMAFARGGRAWYFYGGSTGHERARMPTYLLQWETMRWAAGKGCTEYDLWGVPDHDEVLLEAQFSSRRGGLWGVYRFKRGFGGRLIRTAGAWDRPYSRPLYLAYRLLFRRPGD